MKETPDFSFISFQLFCFPFSYFFVCDSQCFINTHHKCFLITKHWLKKQFIFLIINVSCTYQSEQIFCVRGFMCLLFLYPLVLIPAFGTLRNTKDNSHTVRFMRVLNPKSNIPYYKIGITTIECANMIVTTIRQFIVLNSTIHITLFRGNSTLQLTCNKAQAKKGTDLFIPQQSKYIVTELRPLSALLPRLRKCILFFTSKAQIRQWQID